MPWHPLGRYLFCVVGMGQYVMLRGLMDVLASLGGSAAFTWQAWDNVHKGSDVRPGVPCFPRLLHADVGQCALPRCKPWRPLVSAWFTWQGWDNMHLYALASLGLRRLHGRRGTISTAKGSDICPGVPWFTPRLCGRYGSMYTAKGSDVRPGVPWFTPRLRGRSGSMYTAKGSDVRPGVPWSPPRLRGRPGTMYTAKRSDIAVPWSPPRLRVRYGTMCTAKGSDVRPGVPWFPTHCTCTWRGTQTVVA